MDRFTLAVVGGVLALVVVGLAAAAVLRDRAQPPDPTTPGGVVLTYELAEQRGDPQTAWDLLAASAQAKADHERFLAFAGHPDTAYLTTENEQIDSLGASVVLVRTTPASGGIFGGSSYSSRTTVRLVAEGSPSAWRISVPPDDYLLRTVKP